MNYGSSVKNFYGTLGPAAQNSYSLYMRIFSTSVLGTCHIYATNGQSCSTPSSAVQEPAVYEKKNCCTN